MNQDRKNQPPRMDYPCRWIYKVIGSDEAAMRLAIADIMTCDCDVTPSRNSASGKYLTLDVSLLVEDEASRLSFYDALCKHPSVKLVL